MRYFGNINLQRNRLQNAALDDLTAFPPSPVVGMLAFVNKIVYVCIGVLGNPTWVPLTREISAHSHIQNIALSQWNITHNLNTTTLIPQVYDGDSKIIIPDEIEVVSNTQVIVKFDSPQFGRAVLLSGHLDGGQKPLYGLNYEQTEISEEWVVDHNFGYFPIVRVFVDNQEVQPLEILNDSLFRVRIRLATAATGIVRLL